LKTARLSATRRSVNIYYKSMLFISLLRAVKFSLQDIIRNIWLSLVIIIILILALFSINLLYTVKVIGQATVSAVKEKIDVSLFLKNDATEEEILALSQRLKSLPDVKNVDYISKDKALAAFTDKHQDNQEIIDALKQLKRNPLSPTLIIKPNSFESIDDLSKRLDALDSPLIESRNFANYKLMLQKIDSITAKVAEAGLLISLIFAVITILVVYNSVRVATYTHRREIAIMRLVGASSWFIKLPFVFSGLIYALVSLGAIVAVYFLFLTVLQPYLEAFFVSYNINLLEHYRENFFTIFATQFVAAALVNIIASLSALRVYSKI